MKVKDMIEALATLDPELEIGWKVDTSKDRDSWEVYYNRSYKGPWIRKVKERHGLLYESEDGTEELLVFN
jgi:hypothetical protein